MLASCYHGCVSISSVPGFDVLRLNDNGTPAQPTQATTPSTTPAPSAAENPYQQTYDQIETWSAHYLMQAVEFGAPQIPQFTAGQSVDSFAQLTNTLAAIQPGVQNGTYGDGTGSNVDAAA